MKTDIVENQMFGQSEKKFNDFDDGSEKSEKPFVLVKMEVSVRFLIKK